MPVLWWAAFAGHERLVGPGLVVAGATDYLDGLLARRLGVASPAGGRLDAAADVVVLLSAALCLIRLHPRIATENSGLLTATVFTYGVSLVIGITRSGRMRHLRLRSSKLAGASLYAFALFTLLSGNYVPIMLVIATCALMASSVETIAVVLLARPARDDRRHRRAGQTHDARCASQQNALSD